MFNKIFRALEHTSLGHAGVVSLTLGGAMVRLTTVNDQKAMLVDCMSELSEAHIAQSCAVLAPGMVRVAHDNLIQQKLCPISENRALEDMILTAMIDEGKALSDSIIHVRNEGYHLTYQAKVADTLISQRYASASYSGDTTGYAEIVDQIDETMHLPVDDSDRG